MSAGTVPSRWPRSGSEGAALVWVNALSSGVCTPDEFLRAVRDQFQGNPDEGWEVLSLLDQYYRRGKIEAEIFHTLRSRLEGSAMNGDAAEAASLRPPPSIAITTPPAAAAAPPAAAPPAAAPASLSPARAAAPPRPSDSPSAVRETAIGDVLRDRYRICGLLGRGGRGAVFEAIDEYRLDLPTTGQRLAIKVAHRGLGQQPDALSELQREFQHLQLLSHPNIVRVHEFDRDGDVAFFTMELLNGALLSRLLGTRNAIALPRPYALAVMRDVGAALAYAHSRGVVHGDINPQNIFISNDGELRVLDFGGTHELLRDRWSADNELPQRVPEVTPGYASCQVLEGQHPDARDDVFAFACVAYVLLSGQHPFPYRTAIEACGQRLHARRPSGLSGHQWRVLQEGLRWERDRRPADVKKWLDRFGLTRAAPRLPSLPVLVNATPPGKPRLLLAVTVIGLFALACVGYWAATDYDALVRHLTEWGGQARSSLESTGLLKAVPESASISTSAPAPALAPASTHLPASTPGRPAVARPTHSPAVARAAPNSDTLALVGNAAPPVHIELAADTVDVQATEATAHIIVRRRGSIHGDVSFTWWTESGTAKPERDFAPVVPHVEHIEDGSSGVTLNIPISATPRAQSKSFYVVIDRADAGPALGARTLTMVTLQPPDQQPPVSDP